MTRPSRRLPRTGFTMVGVLVTIIIIVILFALAMQAAKQGLGGGGTSIEKNQVSTHVDRENLRRIYQGMAVFASSNDFIYPSPTQIAQSRDISLNTSANFWSSLIAQGIVAPQQLISENERNWNVIRECTTYNVESYNPARGLYWDTSFKADLTSESNVSFAHLVLHGERFRQHWRMGGDASTAIFGNRGPKDGAPNPGSLAVDSGSGAWRGNVVFGDGHIEFLTVPYYSGRANDNLFMVDDGPNGRDSILGFTARVWNGGFDLQWD